MINKSSFLLVALAVLLLSILVIPEVLAVKFEKTQEGVEVEEEIYSILEKDSSSKVIILLKEPTEEAALFASLSKEQRLEKKKEKVKERQDKVLAALSEKEFKIKRKYSLSSELAGNITKDGLEKLKHNPDIERIYLDGELSLFLSQSVPLINADDVWNKQINGVNIKGNSETVCVIDSGVDYTHPAFGACSKSKFLEGKCDKVIGGYDFYDNDNDPKDEFFHGTFVAGIIVSMDSIYKGVAPEAKIAALKVVDAYGNINPSFSDVDSAIDWCIDNAAALDISVISMSLGKDLQYNNENTYPCSGSGTTNLIKTAVDQGIAVVAASGNSKFTNGIAFPACSPDVISVGATYDANVGSAAHPYYGCTDSSTAADKVACFSNSDELLDLLAPGAVITSSIPNGKFIAANGTSASAPHVSGVIALMQQASKLKNGKALTPVEILDVLKKTGKPVLDNRDGISLTFPRVNALSAIEEINKDEACKPGWDKTVNLGEGYYSDYSESVAVDKDNNIIFAGYSDFFSSDSADYFYDFWIAKYDSDGNHLWNRSSSLGDFDHIAKDIAIDSNGNIIIAGYTPNSDYLTVKYDSDGNEMWALIDDFVLGGASANGVAVDSGNNIIITGGAGADSSTFKYDNNGNVLWWVATEYAGIGSDVTAYDIATDSQDNIIVVGETNSNYFFIIKYGKYGNKLWAIQTAKNPYFIDNAAVAIDSKDNIIITGPLFVIKYDKDGNVLWETPISWTVAPGYYAGIGEDMIIDSKDNIILVGYWNDKMLIEKYNPDGFNLWEVIKRKIWEYSSKGKGVALDAEDNIVIAAETDSPITARDFWILKKYDKYGNEGTDICKNTFKISLVKGRNIISLPLRLESYSIKDIFSNVDYDTITDYNYKKLVNKKKDAESSILQELIDRVGYEVKTYSPSTITISGSVKNDKVYYPLYSGRNWISYPSLEEKPVSEVFKYVDFESIETYENGNKKFYYKYKPEKNTLSTMKPGYGYKLRLTSGANWKFNGTNYIYN